MDWGQAQGSCSALARAQDLLVDQAVRIWLVEPSIPFARDRRLQLPGGLYGDFADASLV